MNKDLADQERRDLINYRLTRCRETLKEADYLIVGEFYNAALNRLYYACYYAVLALLVANKLSAQSHVGVKTIFSLSFVKNERVNKELAKVFFKLFDLRHNNDYEDFSFCDRETIEKLRPIAGRFISTIEGMID